MDITLFLTVIEEDEKKRKAESDLLNRSSEQSSIDNSTPVEAD